MKIYSLIFLTLFVSNLSSQNLVSNNDFSEVFDWQSRNLRQGWYDRVDWVTPHWNSPTRATPDFFCCADKSKRLSSRSEEHTSELQSRPHLVCRLLLEKKKKKRKHIKKKN